MITLKQYLTNKNDIILESANSDILLLEGGQFAENLIPELIKNSGNENLKYTRATPTQDVLGEVDIIYNLLVDNNFIEPRKPSYILGSSRLFAIATGIKEPQPNKYETERDISKALKTKNTFGDIDLDVHFKPGVKASTISSFINNHDRSKYMSGVVAGELSIATVVDGTDNVIQIDVVDITDKEDYLGFSQFSSMADMSHGIKGVIRDVLVRALAASHPIPAEQKQGIIDLVKSTEIYQTIEAKSKVDLDIDVRYSLGGDGLMLKIIWIKDGEAKKHAITFQKVKYEKVTDIIDNQTTRTYGYDRMDMVAQILGFEDPEDLKHVTRMVETIATFDKDRKQRIWNSMINNLTSKVPSERRKVGQISMEEARQSVAYMAKYFRDIDLTANGENIFI